jgi:hypothetical protein
MHRIAALVVVSLAAVACSDDQPVEVGAADGRSPEEVLTGTATVLESAEHGPQLCLGGVLDSLPPQCGGPDIVGWDWADAAGEESADGTTWGEYTVVGTYANGVFTVTEPPRAPEPRDEPSQVSSDTPCPEPAGGWRVADAATTTQATQDATIAAAQVAADFSGAWVDQSINPVYADGELTDGEEGSVNDPTALILNLRFTGDVERHETELRPLWGGSLCVSEGQFTEEELLQIQQELDDRYDLLWSSGDTIGERVEVGVIVAEGLQAEVDARYGEGVVHVQPALTPR